MSDVKWIKIATDVFDDEKILLLESMPSHDTIIVIWFKLLVLAGKQNNSGVFMLNDRIAYTEEMLATIFRRDVGTVKLALKAFESYGMIEIIDNVITIPNWGKHQTLDKLESKKEYQKNYMRDYREKQKQLSCKSNSKTNSKTNSKERESNSNTNVSSLEEEREEDKEIDKEEREEDKKNTSSAKADVDLVLNKWNELSSKHENIPPVLKLTNNRMSKLKARIKEFGLEKVVQAIENINQSNFLKGENDRGWVIDFSWFIVAENFLKVLEGKYTNNKSSKSVQISAPKSKNPNFTTTYSHNWDLAELEKREREYVEKIYGN